jgi:hypothetical protein
MFDIQEALSTLDGRCYSYADLRTAMSKIRIRHLADLPPEVGVNELIRIARQKSLIQEDQKGQMCIHVGELEHR